MPLVPGPFDLQTDDAVAINPGVYDFTDDALTLAADVQSNVQGWNDFLADLTIMASDPLDDLTGLDIDALLLAVSYSGSWSDLPNLDTAITNYDDASTMLYTAVSFAPAAAWQDPPAPFVPPGSELNLSVPVVPINAYVPGSSGVVGDQSNFARPTVQLWNFTRVGATNFVEGDTYEIALLGSPGQSVSVGGTFNGAPLTITAMGTLDPLGNLGLQGVMGPDVVGAWHEDWYFDDALVTSFDFIVSPGGQ